jgi:Xaa-Pro aminopeptidase
MSTAAEPIVLPSASNPEMAVLDTMSDRRTDIESKQTVIAGILRDAKADGLLILEQENFAWLSSGGAARGVLDGDEQPALFFTAEQRWALSSNCDSQRLFDEELDGLGFQLKEWPWHWGREQLLADLCQKRKVVCDRSYRDCQSVADILRRRRRTLTRYEQACYRALGSVVTHAVEATCRGLEPGTIEREVAGQLGHRLLHRGAYPVLIGVAADRRANPYRQSGFTAAPIKNHCLVWVTARKYGLCATASRAVSFGPVDDELRKEHDAACKVSATYVAASWPDAVPREILNAGRRIYQLTGYEHEWRLCPQGGVTGRAPIEQPMTPKTEELLQKDWAVTWRASVGSATSCDTYLISDKGPEFITAPQLWPQRKIRFQGVEFVRPFLLER